MNNVNNGRGDSRFFNDGKSYIKMRSSRPTCTRCLGASSWRSLQFWIGSRMQTARNKRSVQTGELAALRNAHRSLRVLEQLYFAGNSGKMVA